MLIEKCFIRMIILHLVNVFALVGFHEDYRTMPKFELRLMTRNYKARDVPSTDDFRKCSEGKASGEFSLL